MKTIVVRLDEIMARRKISINELAAANLSILKTGKAKAIRFSTLEVLCKAFDCQPGDLLAYQQDKING
jgi:putative transcriptional regulator